MMDETADYEVADESVTGRPGKYWFHTEAKEREFVLDCGYENLTREQLDAIYVWLHRDTSGTLVFGDRPWCHYNVRPTKRITGERYRGVMDAADGKLKYAGKLTITFTAYEPFALMDVTSYSSTNANDEAIQEQMGMSGILHENMAPVLQPASSSVQLLYNPGTERTNRVLIRISGSVGNDGLTIRNLTTGEQCVLIGLPANNRVLLIDSYTGTVRYEDTGEFAFAFHNHGYLTLAGCGMFRRGVTVTVKRLSPLTVRSDSALFSPEIDKGQYVYFNNEWHRILSISGPNELVLTDSQFVITPVGETASIITAAMNEIQIVGTDVNLTEFDLQFTPLVR